MPGSTDVDFVTLEFASLGITLRAKMTTSSSPALRDAFLDALPFETVYSHTMASGYGLYAPTRIVGNFETEWTLLTELPVGALCLITDSYKTLGLYYGEITEPLPETLPIAYVVPEDIDDLKLVGREVWLSNYFTHDPIVVKISAVPAGNEVAA